MGSIQKKLNRPERPEQQHETSWTSPSSSILPSCYCHHLLKLTGSLALSNEPLAVYHYLVLNFYTFSRVLKCSIRKRIQDSSRFDEECETINLNYCTKYCFKSSKGFLSILISLKQQIKKILLFVLSHVIRKAHFPGNTRSTCSRVFGDTSLPSLHHFGRI